MKWICSTKNEYWKEMKEPDGAEASFVITTGSEGQTMRGFGACFSELGYESLGILPDEEREKVMRELFSPECCAFNFCRIPVGANDFAVSWYSLNETDDDYDMEHFSIERDKKRLIPFIKNAKKYCPELQLFASPWSPPTWMKTPAVYNFGRLNADERTLEAYALYFLKFVQAYREEGIEIKRICPQNEVFANQKFPSCLYTGELMRDFIRDHLGPMLEKNSPETEIWLGTINGPYCDYLHEDWERQHYTTFTPVVLMDREARKYIHGAAVQWGAKHIMNQLRLSYPELPIIQSECECGDGRNSPDDIPYVFELLWQYVQQGAESFVYWNISLDETAASTWGWKQNSLVTVDQTTKQWHWNPEFYFMKHVSAFVPASAKHIATHGEWTSNILAFECPNGSYSFLTVNPYSEPQSVTISCKVGTKTFILPPESLSSINIDGK